jgi:hypothetical protein
LSVGFTSNTSSDLDRIRTLVARRAWTDVAALSDHLLRGSSSHRAPVFTSLLDKPATCSNDTLLLESQQTELVEIMMIHCHALLVLKNYQELKKEMDQVCVKQLQHVELTLLYGWMMDRYPL